MKQQVRASVHPKVAPKQRLSSSALALIQSRSAHSATPGHCMPAPPWPSPAR